MLTTSCSTLGDGILAVNYEKGCHDCGNENPYLTCGFECEHEEEEITCEGYVENAHTYHQTNMFCNECYGQFEECACGCGTKICYECAEYCERCSSCKAPFCCDSKDNECKKNV